MSDLIAAEYKCFEDIKRTRLDGSEYWCARELASVLAYNKWENFHKVIKRAMIACENSGHSIPDHFPGVRKMIELAKGAQREITDYELSRYACYLIVQNGDPRKEVIALGQTYFAIQTYRQEVADHFNQLDEDSRRLVVRGDIKQWNQLLAETAQNAGVITAEEFAIFQNAGYMGLYGGMTVDDIHKKKGLTNKGWKAVSNALKGRLFPDDDQYTLALSLLSTRSTENVCHITLLDLADAADFFAVHSGDYRDGDFYSGRWTT